MALRNLSRLFLVYGAYMVICGFIPFVMRGEEARAAVGSGLFSGILAFVIAYFLHAGRLWAYWMGNLLLLLLLGVFGWRSATAFMKLLDLIIFGDAIQVPARAVAFLIMSSMFILSLIVLAFSVYHAGQVLEPEPRATLDPSPPISTSPLPPSGPAPGHP
jgi:uncharacterized membrane protein (UPF0136 family)